MGHLSNVSLWEFALGRRAVRIRAGPEEGVGAEPVVREGLDEEERARAKRECDRYIAVALHTVVAPQLITNKQRARAPPHPPSRKKRKD